MIKKISNHSLYGEHKGFKRGEVPVYVALGKNPHYGAFYRVFMETLKKPGNMELPKKTSMFQQST